MEQNLRALVDSDLRPDLIAFGEYRDSSFGDHFKNFLDENFPEQTELIPYNDRKIEGFKIWSRYPLEILNKEALGFFPPGADEAERERYRQIWVEDNPDAANYERVYLRVKVDLPVRPSPPGLCPHLVGPKKAV